MNTLPQPYHPDASHVHPSYRDGWNAAIAATATREWVGLTDEERHNCLVLSARATLANTEAKLKAKNTPKETP